MDLARELADGPQVAMRLLKRSLYNAAEMPLLQAFDDIAAKTAISDHHPDAARRRRGVPREARGRSSTQWLETEMSEQPERWSLDRLLGLFDLEEIGDGHLPGPQSGARTRGRACSGARLPRRPSAPRSSPFRPSGRSTRCTRTSSVRDVPARTSTCTSSVRATDGRSRRAA